MTLVLAVLLVTPALLNSPAPAVAAAPASVGPTFGDAGVVRTPLRSSSTDFATALTVGPDGQYLLAAGAGGDFGFARFTTGVSDVNGTYFQSRTTTDFGGTDDVPRAAATTASDRFVLAGSAGGDLSLARYERTGVLDRTFDGDGRVTLDLGSASDTAYAVVPLADGRLVVVGGTPAVATVLRFLPDGAPDLAFGAGGRVALPSTGPGRAAALQPDGKLLVAGGGDSLVVYRLQADGALDSGFGTGGVASLGVSGAARANAMVLGADGMITVAGSRGPDVIVARFDAIGRPDRTFGTLGVTITPVAGGGAGFALAQRPDGGLLVAGDAGTRGMLARYRPDGTTETSFGTNGVFVTRPDVGDQVERLRAVAAHPQVGWVVAGAVGANAYVHRIGEVTDRIVFGNAVDFGTPRQEVTAGVVQSDGKVVAVVEAGGQTGLVRYNADGSRDAAFGIAGIVVSDRVGYPRGVALQSSGRILVAGMSSSPSRAAVAAFAPDGSVDTAFGDDGLAGMEMVGDTQMASGVAVTADDRVVLTGGSDSGGTVSRFLADGRPDPTFGQGGRALGAFPGHAGPRVHPTVVADGRILVLTYPRHTSNDRALFRLNADGSLDRSFGTDGSLPLGGRAAFTVQPDGRILVAGTTSHTDGDIAVVRFLPDGTADTSWQTVFNEFRTFNGGMAAHSAPSTIAVQPDGRVVVGGTAMTSYALVRLNSDGTKDLRFGVDGRMLVRIEPGAPPALVVPTATSGLLVVATAGSGSWPAEGVLLARIATGPLGAPTRVTAVAGSGSARVRWSVPPLFDESPATAYRVRASDGVHTALTPDGQHTSAVVRGLAPGQAYTFTVEAVRAAGAGPASAPSNAVTATMSGPTSAWGWNGPATLGDGTILDRLRPLTGAGVPGAVALAAGALHSLSLRADGTVWASGWNNWGQLGDGTTTNRSRPVQVAGLTNVAAIAAGAYHSIALKRDGTVWAWGWNGAGQIGNGSTKDALVPVNVAGLSGIKSISAGFHHNLAVRPDGTVAAWGWNVAGQLGDNSTTDRWRPQAVPGLTGVTAVAGGAIHSLALMGDGSLWAWGMNNVGQLGTFDLVDRHTPARLPSIYGIVAIAAGAFHNYGINEEGRVRSWGWNAFGQLGNPSASVTSGGLEVWDVDDVATIASGWYHGLAIKHDGSVVTWGWNVLGQLGDGTTVDRNTARPVNVPPAIAVAGGALHSLAA
jgi:uncharacterized delta-60 repeat protein